MAARITAEQERFIVSQLTLALPYTAIQEKFLKKFNRTINPITLGRVRKKQLPAIIQGKQMIAEEGAVNATLLKQKSHRLLDARLEAAISDQTEIEKLRKQLQNGEISMATYKDKVAVYERLTVTELVKVSESMHTQAKGEDDDVVSPQDQAALAALIAGIQSGNPVQLIQVLGNQSVPNTAM